MAEKSIRFGISDCKQNRSSTWKCWIRTKVEKNDVYLACRALGSAFKASLHESGHWHVAYSKNFFKKNLSDSQKTEKGRFIQKWFKPAEIAPGVVLAYRFVIPSSAINVPYKQSKKIHWIPNAAKGKATEICILITKTTTKVSNWPSKNSMNTKLVDSMQLDNGSTVWIVYHEVEMPQLPSIPNPKFYKGKTKDDLLNGENLRVLLMADMEDGSRVFYDCAMDVREEIDN